MAKFEEGKCYSVIGREQVFKVSVVGNRSILTKNYFPRDKIMFSLSYPTEDLEPEPCVEIEEKDFDRLKDLIDKGENMIREIFEKSEKQRCATSRLSPSFGYVTMEDLSYGKVIILDKDPKMAIVARFSGCYSVTKQTVYWVRDWTMNSSNGFYRIPVEEALKMIKVIKMTETALDTAMIPIRKQVEAYKQQ